MVWCTRAILVTEVDVLDVNLDVVDDLGGNGTQICLFVYCQSAWSPRTLLTIVMAVFDFISGVVHGFGASQSLLLRGLVDALVLLWINLALGTRSCQNIDIVNLNLGRLVLDCLPRNGN